MSNLNPPSVNSVALMAAAVVLARTHGARYASYLLLENGVRPEVVHELLGTPQTSSSMVKLRSASDA